ncbi:MAG TPA: deoxyribose-phosphate aldolase [Phycisphaeraceae bacterium]
MSIAQRIDHTTLKPEADEAAIDRLADEALEHGFASACVNGRFVARLAQRLRGSQVKTCAVVGFPLGAMKPTVKAIEATAACKDSADEIDFVAHLPHLLAADLNAARQEFLEITRAARSVNPAVIIKVIIESAVLMHQADEATIRRRIEAACLAARESGCDFVKTSTGFHPAGGATVEAVRLIKSYAGPLKVKAAGGIRSYTDAVRLIEAGADRLGCSAGVAIVQGQHAADTAY